MSKYDKYGQARKLFARNMRIRRIKAELSQEKLADICKLHRNYVGSVERGERNISIDNMEIIASSLGCTISDLLEKD